MSYALLDKQGPQQWPFPDGQYGKARLYEEKIFATKNGRAKFYPAAYMPVAEEIDTRYPFHLISGRLRDQWHGMSRSGRVSRLHAHSEEPMLEMHADDMSHLSLNAGDIVKLSSRRGCLSARVTAEKSLKKGQVFLPMHWSAQMMKGAGVNALTIDTMDPLSKQPELKHAAVQITKLELPWRLLLIAGGNVMLLREELKPWLEKFSYATVTQFGRDRDYLLFQAWHESVPAFSHMDRFNLDDLDRLAGLDDPQTTASYSDARRGISKKARIENNKLTAIRFTGEVAAAQWLRELIQEEGSVDTLRPWLFSPLATSPVARPSRGKIICACMDVSENEIKASIANEADLDTLKQTLKCGTGCGSCVPELKQLLVKTPG